MANSVSKTVGTGSPTQLTSLLAQHCMIQNLGPYQVAIGGSGVTFATGVLVPPNTPLAAPVGLTALESLHAIADPGAGAGTSDVRVLSYLG